MHAVRSLHWEFNPGPHAHDSPMLATTWKLCFIRRNKLILIHSVKHLSFLLPCSLRKWKYGDGKKNRVRDYCTDSDSTTLKTWKKVVFRKVSVCLSVYLSVCRFIFLANDNSRKFKQNQIIFCIQPLFVEYSRHIVFGEDRLRGRGSLPATF